MRELLRNAKVGDAFKTTNGRKAVISYKVELGDVLYGYFVETKTNGICYSYFVNADGIVCHGENLTTTVIDKGNKDNLVGIWDNNNQTNEDLVRYIAEYCTDDKFESLSLMGIREIVTDAFTAGYNKALNTNSV